MTEKERRVYAAAVALYRACCAKRKSEIECRVDMQADTVGALDVLCSSATHLRICAQTIEAELELFNAVRALDE